MSSIYEVAAAVATVLGSVTAPETPAVARVVPPGHGDDRHAPRAARCWINVEPLGESHEDEVNNSDLAVYSVRFHGWYAVANRDISTTAQKLGTFGAAIITALKHSTLGGITRHPIALEHITDVKYETGGGETDAAYVVRGDVEIHRQQ